MSTLFKLWGLVVIHLFFINLNETIAQVDSSFQLPSFVQDELETYLENLGTESEFDFNDLGDHLAQYLRTPINLNKATFEDLQAFGLLSDIQIADFLNYRDQLGDLTSIYEMQSVPSLDQHTIEKIRPFVSISESNTLNSTALIKMLTTGRNELYLRSTRVLEKQQGYRETDQRPPNYLGSPNQYYVRFKHQFEQKLSYGFTLEKDAGEPFMTRSSPGFDFYSFHFIARDLTKHLKSIAFGDFAISMGQGLIMHSGYGSGKGSFVTKIKRGGRSLRPYTSVNEASYLRGAAATMSFRPFSVTVFASKTKRDANLRIDSLDQEEALTSFSSLQTSGYHRTLSEIADKDAIAHTTIGMTAGYQKNRVKLNINALYNYFNQPFSRSLRPYNQFYFRGQNLTNLSLDYSYIYRNFNIYGETAVSDNGALATLNGVMLALSRYVDLVLLHRDLSYKYQALQASPFMESSVPTNERGLYLGSEIKLNQSFWISIYADYWKHPWLRFSTDAPSVGNEYFTRITYYKKRKLECYAQYKSENKAVNERHNNAGKNQLFYRHKKNFRLQINHKIHQNLELRNRLELTSVSSPTQNNSRGFLLYQDVIYKSIRSPLSFTGRLCYFDTDDYNARIYAYENDILYSFSIPAYFERGFRYYLNLRLRKGNLTLEGRLEQTRFADLTTISSGNEKIIGNVKTRIKLQCRYVF